MTLCHVMLCHVMSCPLSQPGLRATTGLVLRHLACGVTLLLYLQLCSESYLSFKQPSNVLTAAFLPGSLCNKWLSK